jgi:hypothetical protein
MNYFLVALAVSIPLCIFVFPYWLRSYARNRAARFVAAPILVNVKWVKRCISILTWSNKWITKHPDMDLNRIRQLKSIFRINH